MKYFFELIKNNAIILSIIMGGNLNNINLNNLKGVDYFFPTDSGLVITNYDIGNEHFENVTIIVRDEFNTTINFQTKESKFYENPEVYFGNLTDEIVKKPYELNNIQINRSNINLGDFKHFDKSINVIIFKSSSYGYCISLNLKKDVKDYTH